ncbi:hypothetical protein Tco_0842453 [Tanacetum coccineum]|uniref:Uncharacterized protein n=1 Tax=Tanacetum coccineum TaxID=301880 RepID=A0ABQ5B076_9ASTR
MMPKAKGLNVLSKVALTKDGKLKLATKKSKTQFYSSHRSGSGDGVDTQSKVPDEQHLKMTSADEGTGTIPGVPDVPIYESESEKDSWDDSGEEDEDDKTIQKIKVILMMMMMLMMMITKKKKKRLDDEENTIDDEDEDKEDAHVTLTPVLDTQKDDEPVQSSSVSSDFTCKLLNLENPSPTDNEIASLMETSAHHAMTVPKITSGSTTKSSTWKKISINKAIQAHNLDCKQQAHGEKNAYIELIDISMRAIIKEEVKTLTSLDSSSSSIRTFETSVIEKMYRIIRSCSLDKESKSHLRADYKKKLYDALFESYNTDKDLFNSYSEVFTLKRSQDDNDIDRDPLLDQNEGERWKIQAYKLRLSR